MARDAAAESWSSLMQGASATLGADIGIVQVAGPQGERLVGLHTHTHDGEHLATFVVDSDAAMGLPVDLIQEAYWAIGLERDPRIDQLRALLLSDGLRK